MKVLSVLVLVMFEIVVLGANKVTPPPSPTTHYTPPPVVYPAPFKFNTPQTQQSTPAPRPVTPYVQPSVPSYKPEIFDYAAAARKRVLEEKIEKKKTPDIFIIASEKDHNMESAQSVLATGSVLPTTTLVFSQGFAGSRAPNLNSQVLALSNLVTDTKRDILVAEYALKNDQMLAEENARLHKQNEALYAKQVIPKQQFEDSRSRLVRSELRVVEASARLLEYQSKLALAELRFKEAQGNTIANLDFAKAYTNIEKAKLSKFEAMKNQAKTEADYHDMVLAMQKKLALTGATSELNVIEAEKDSEQSNLAVKLLESLMVETRASYEQSLKLEKGLEPTSKPE